MLNHHRRNSKTEVDMLHGPLLRKLLLFALPFAASSILQQLFNSVDVAIVGKFASSEALAAVGTNTPVISLFLNLFVGISLGTNVVIANFIGQRKRADISKAVTSSMLIALVSGFVLVFVGWIGARPILLMMGTPAAIVDKAVLYLRIYMLGAPFILLYNFGAAILRSMGDSSRPLYVLIVAGIINTLLNLVMVVVFHMDVAGVAIATTVSNVVSAGCIIYILIHENEPFKLNFRGMKVEKSILRRILLIGVPAGLQSSVFSVANVFVQSAINSYGHEAIAGNAAALTFEFLTYFFVAAFSGAATTFVGQNYGAGNIDRCKRVFVLCMIMSVFSSGVFAAAVTWQGEYCLRLFTSDPQVVHYGMLRFEYAMLWIFLTSIYEIPSACMRAFGYSMTPAVLTILGTCVLRLVWIYCVTPWWPGFEHLILAYPASWILTGAMVVVAFKITLNKVEAKLITNGR